MCVRARCCKSIEMITQQLEILKIFIVTGVILLSSGNSNAQLQTAGVSGNLPDAPARQQPLTFREAFEKGKVNGYFRSYFMATDNTRQLTDYYAWAVGGGIRYQSAVWRGFSIGSGGTYAYRLMSSGLLTKDSITGASNRYENGLFDIEHPENQENVGQVSEMWLRYQFKKSRITLGRQTLNTPFINPQDGRMRPTGESGVWLESNVLKNTRLEGGWLWRITPRGTVKWYGIGESIGLYPKGLNPDGSGSNYPQNLHSKGIGLLGITRQIRKNVKLQVWDQYVENIYNTAFTQADFNFPLKKGHQLLAGIQFTHQNALSDGGNEDVSKTYFQKGGQSNILSAQTGWQHRGWQALAGYTRVTAVGRFLSPREWGREPFYTFTARERVEGSGDSHSITGRLIWQNTSKKWRIEAVYGHFYLPDVKKPALNKYAFPAFNQFNFDVRYQFSGALEGLRVQFLYAGKGRLGEVYGNDKYVINKVDMSHFNLILNYTY